MGTAAGRPVAGKASSRELSIAPWVELRSMALANHEEGDPVLAGEPDVLAMTGALRGVAAGRALFLAPSPPRPKSASTRPQAGST